MRVLVITGSFPPLRCGVGDYSYKLSKALSNDSKISVGVLTSVFDGTQHELDIEGIKVFPVMPSWRMRNIVQVIKIISRWMPDIVHIQYPTQGYRDGFLPFMLPMVCFMMGKKIVQTWHEGYSRRNVIKLFLKAIIPGGLVLVRPNYKANIHPLLRWAWWNKKLAYIKNASAIPRSDIAAHSSGELKEFYLNGQKRLIVFFGFIYPHKGVDLLFDIADPVIDRIVIAGEFNQDDPFHQTILRLCSSRRWLNKVTITGFLPPGDVAALLAVADAVVLPFRLGGGDWNTSMHGAILQGTFVISTSLTKKGYDEKTNVYFAEVDNVKEMKLALDKYAGTRRQYNVDIDKDEWKQIAIEHRLLYEQLLLK